MDIKMQREAHIKMVCPASKNEHEGRLKKNQSETLRKNDLWVLRIMQSRQELVNSFSNKDHNMGVWNIMESVF